MNTFKAKASLPILILRIITCLFFGSIALLLILAYIASFILSYPTPLIMHFVFPFAIILLTGGFFSYYRPLITQSKNYLISESSIEEFNLILRSLKKYDKNQVKGFSTSSISYKFGTYKQIIIYLENDKKIELVQFVFSNFKEIEQALIENNYNYFGQEPEYITYLSKSRTYLFDVK